MMRMESILLFGRILQSFKPRATIKMEEGYWESLEGARVSVLTGDIESGLRLSTQIVNSAEGLVLQEDLA